jgi:hypothetical protein
MMKPPSYQQGIARRILGWQNPSWVHLLVVLPWVIGSVYGLRAWREDSALAARQQTANGKIIAHEPANHDRYGYTFSIGARTYRGWEIPHKREYSIGEQITVYYDPIDPNRSALTSFEELSLRDFGLILLLLMGSATVVFIIYRRRKHFRIGDQQSP